LQAALESKGVVFSKHVSGTLSGATFGTPNAEGVRKPVLQKGEIAVDKESGPDFSSSSSTRRCSPPSCPPA